MRFLASCLGLSLSPSQPASQTDQTEPTAANEAASGVLSRAALTATELSSRAINLRLVVAAYFSASRI